MVSLHVGYLQVQSLPLLGELDLLDPVVLVEAELVVWGGRLRFQLFGFPGGFLRF